MSTRVDELSAEIMTLSRGERIEIAERIWDSIEGPRCDAEPMSESVRAAVEEAIRRDADMSSGKDPGVPHEEVMARLRRIVACD